MELIVELTTVLAVELIVQPIAGLTMEPAVELATGVEDGAVLLRGSAGAVRDGSAVRLAGGATPSASAPR